MSKKNKNISKMRIWRNVDMRLTWIWGKWGYEDNEKYEVEKKNIRKLRLWKNNDMKSLRIWKYEENEETRKIENTDIKLGSEEF